MAKKKSTTKKVTKKAGKKPATKKKVAPVVKTPKLEKKKVSEDKKNILFISVIVIILLATGILFFNNYFGEEQITTDQKDAVDVIKVASINGEAIYSNEVSQLIENYASQGMQISEEDAIEQIINIKLLYNKAIESGFDLSMEDVEEEISFYMSMQGLTLEDFKQQLAEMGVSYEEQMENIQKEFVISNYIDNIFNNLELSVSDEEIKEMYEFYSLMYEDEMPSLEEVEQDLYHMILQEKEAQLVEDLIEELKEEVEIEYN